MTPHGKAHHIVHCWNSPASYEEGYSTAADTGLTRTIPSAREDSLTHCIVFQNGSLSRTRDGSDRHSLRALRVRNHTMMLRSNASSSIDSTASCSRVSSGSSSSSLVAFMLRMSEGVSSWVLRTEVPKSERAESTDRFCSPRAKSRKLNQINGEARTEVSKALSAGTVSRSTSAISRCLLSRKRLRPTWHSSPVMTPVHAGAGSPLQATSRRPRPSWRCLQKSRGVTADATEWRTAC